MQGGCRTSHVRYSYIPAHPQTVLERAYFNTVNFLIISD